MPYANPAELWRREAEPFGPLLAVRFKRHGLYHDLSWDDYAAQAIACAAALVEQGIEPGDRVGLLSENRLEWLLADMGILAVGAGIVPPHAPLHPQQTNFQLAHAAAPWLLLSQGQPLEKIRSRR